MIYHLCHTSFIPYYSHHFANSLGVKCSPKTMFKTQCWVLRKFPEPNNALSVLKEEGHIHTPPNCKAHFGLKGTLKENK